MIGKIMFALAASRRYRTLEWTTRKGRTYQLSALRGMEGAWERFFHADSHPTRRRVGRRELLAAFWAAKGPIRLLAIAGEPVELSRGQVLARARVRTMRRLKRK